MAWRPFSVLFSFSVSGSTDESEDVKIDYRMLAKNEEMKLTEQGTIMFTFVFLTPDFTNDEVHDSANVYQHPQ